MYNRQKGRGAHREKGDMYLEKGMDGEGSLQYVGSEGVD